MTDADERLLVEAAQRDPSKFGDLYERHFHRVYAFVVRRVRDRDAAEDVTAEVFHKALAGLPQYEWRGAPFGAWLIRIAANAVQDRVRRPGHEALAPDAAVSEPVVQRELEEVERTAAIFRFVDQLPVDQRAVIIERYVEERSIREVAARLRKSEGAVKQLQLRALQTLRSRMEAAHA
ncbi:MAG TPA: RNA polymerase sigma factor [Vicinamibacterales bacterium]|nr:RNA polymerase sigma factor [Vicinamibacterales bacterium]